MLKINEYDEHQSQANCVLNELSLLFRRAENDLFSTELIIKEEFIEEDSISVEDIMDIDEEKEHKKYVVGNNVMKEDKPAMYLVSKAPAERKRVKRNIPFRCHQGHVCDLCGRAFNDRSKMLRHREIHNTERNYVCPICSSRFKTSNCLQNHERLHRPQPIIERECDWCGLKYTRKQSLIRHMLKHVGIRNFSCETCGLTFLHNTALKAHSVSHAPESEKRHFCQYCPARFHTKGKLSRHMLGHLPEKSFSCPIAGCASKFSQKYNVNAHIKHVHSGIKPPPRRSKNSLGIKPKTKHCTIAHVCTICGLSFQRSNKLKEHIISEHVVAQNENIA